MGKGKKTYDTQKLQFKVIFKPKYTNLIKLYIKNSINDISEPVLYFLIQHHKSLFRIWQLSILHFIPHLL